MSDAKRMYEKLRARDQALYEKVNKILTRAREMISLEDSLEENEWDKLLSEIYFEIIGLNLDYQKLTRLRIRVIPLLGKLSQQEREEYEKSQPVFENIVKQIEDMRIFFKERLRAKVLH